VIMLDTHIAVALSEGRTGGLSAAAKRAIDREAVSISPAVLLELELLHEIGRCASVPYRFRVTSANTCRSVSPRSASRTSPSKRSRSVLRAIRSTA